MSPRADGDRWRRTRIPSGRCRRVSMRRVPMHYRRMCRPRSQRDQSKAEDWQSVLVVAKTRAMKASMTRSRWWGRKNAAPGAMSLANAMRQVYRDVPASAAVRELRSGRSNRVEAITPHSLDGQWTGDGAPSVDDRRRDSRGRVAVTEDARYLPAQVDRVRDRGLGPAGTVADTANRARDQWSSGSPRV